MGALANGFEQSVVEGEGAATRQPFYFGMSPPDKEEMPSLPTAVGKVHHNETLSQPFRTAPRHRKKENKESEGVREVKIVPVKQQQQQPTTVNKREIVIENNNINFSNKSNNNNNVANMNTVRKSASRVVERPPNEQAQDELSRAFQSQLAAAKLKLRTSGPGGEEEEGAPPPPPPPVLPPVAPVKAPSPPAPPSKPQWEKRVSTLPKGPMVNPRDELMKAIREKAGKPGRSVQAM